MEAKIKIFGLIKSMVVQSEVSIATEQLERNEINTNEYNAHLKIVTDIALSKNWNEFRLIMSEHFSMEIEDVILTYCDFK